MSYYSTPVEISEQRYIDVHGDPRNDEKTREKRRRGLGDLVEYVARRTGIKRIVDKRSARTGKPCGCAQRKAAMNQFTDKMLRR